jgi:hypothetical protein
LIDEALRIDPHFGVQSLEPTLGKGSPEDSCSPTLSRLKKPPLTPEAQLQRILRVARTNGLSVVIIAGLGTLFSLGDWVGVGVGVAVFVGGWMELKGRKQLVHGDIAGVRTLVQSQWVVLGAIEIYCVMMLGFSQDHGVSQELRGAMMEMGVDMVALEPSLRLAFYATYAAVALVSIVYQGGMARYYARRVGVVQEAIAARSRPPAPPVRAADPEDWVT